MTVDKLGPYKIVDRIGAGGMGEVYKAVHEETGQVVAIKILSLSEGDDTQLLKRFRREIVSASRLSHDNIVRLFDSGEQDEHVWYAMEFIEGRSLSDVMVSGQPLSVAEALSIAKDVCKAFVYMHSRGFAHRDIKPGNIMVTREGIAKLVDFGLVKSKFATNITVTGVVIGTPAFMSPEMLQGREVDHRSDIFQLGQVLYKMLAGQGAFQGANPFEIASNCVTGAPRPLTAQNPKVSPALEAVLFLCLEKKPENRYQSAADLLNDLKRVEKGLKPLGIGGGKRAPVFTDTAAVPTQPIPLTAPRKTKPSAAGALAAVALVAAIGVGAWAVLVRGAAGSYDFRNLKVDSGLHLARFTWESDVPYATRASYAPDSGAETGNEVVNAEEGESTRHSLELRNLEPDTEYKLSIVYPDRKQSLPRPFRTLKESLGSHAFTFGAGGAVRLAFTTPAPATTTLRWGRDHDARGEPDGFSTEHSALLTGADLFAESTVQVSCANGLGERWTCTPLPLPDARGAARELAKLAEPMRAEVVLLLGALDRAERQRKPQVPILKDALPKNLADAMAHFAPIGPLFFSSRRPSLEEKAALYHPLSALDALDRYAAERKLPFDSGAVKLLGPDYGPLASPRLPDAESQKFGDTTRLMPSRMSAAEADLVGALERAGREIRMVFPVVNAAGLRHAEVAIKADWQEAFPFEDELAVRINQNTELSLRRNPAASSSSMLFVHGFDPRVLSDGRNELSVTLRPMPGLRSAVGLVVQEIVIRFQR